MLQVQSSPLRSLGLWMLMGGLLAGSLAGCGARRRLQAAETETAAGPAGAATVVVTAASSGPAAGGTSSASLADQLDAELQKMSAELNSADTLNDFSTALPPNTALAAATSVPATAASVAGAPTGTPVPNTPAAGQPTAVHTTAPTAVPSGADQGAQIDQALGSMLDQLNKTDTVPEGANP